MNTRTKVGFTCILDLVALAVNTDRGYSDSPNSFVKKSIFSDIT
jgi:hypothetical protein